MPKPDKRSKLALVRENNKLKRTNERLRKHALDTSEELILVEERADKLADQLQAETEHSKRASEYSTAIIEERNSQVSALRREIELHEAYMHLLARCFGENPGTNLIANRHVRVAKHVHISDLKETLEERDQ